MNPNTQVLRSTLCLLALYVGFGTSAASTVPTPASGRQTADPCGAACPDMRLVHRRNYILGPGEGAAAIRAKGPDFLISEGPVTAAQYHLCVADGACAQPPYLDPAPGSDQPMTDVTWDDARDYVQWLSARTGDIYDLPTADQADLWPMVRPDCSGAPPALADFNEWLRDCERDETRPDDPCPWRQIRPVRSFPAMSPGIRLTDMGFRVVRSPVAGRAP